MSYVYRTWLLHTHTIIMFKTDSYVSEVGTGWLVGQAAMPWPCNQAVGRVKS